MPKRDRVSARRAAGLKQRPCILVVCGAQRTESDYFKGLRGELRSTALDLVVLERSAAPDQVVAAGRDHRPFDDFEERWCVLDVDHFEREGKKISAASKLAADCGMKLAISNPCFEFWLLVHHADRRMPAHGCKPIEAELRRHVPGYDKRRLRFKDFAGGLASAIERGKFIDPSGVNHEANPSSGMWVLVARLLE